MKSNRVYVYGTLLALPFVGLMYYLLNPPQCPLNYTQEQVDTTHCTVGANIGGMPIFIVTTIMIWYAAIWLMKKLATKDTPNKSL